MPSSTVPPDNMGRFDKHRLEPPSHHSLATKHLGQLSTALSNPKQTWSRRLFSNHQLIDPLCLSGYGFAIPYTAAFISDSLRGSASQQSSNAARRTAGAPRLGSSLPANKPYAPLHSDHPRESGNLMFQVWSQNPLGGKGCATLHCLFFFGCGTSVPPAN